MRKITVMNAKPDVMDQPGAFQDQSNLILGIAGLCFVLRIITLRSEDFWREFYAEQAVDPKFPDFDGFVKWRASTYTMETVIEGDDDVVAVVRNQVLVPLRKKYQTSARMNGFHASSSDVAAAREYHLVTRFFWD